MSLAIRMCALPRGSFMRVPRAPKVTGMPSAKWYHPHLPRALWNFSSHPSVPLSRRGHCAHGESRRQLPQGGHGMNILWHRNTGPTSMALAAALALAPLALIPPPSRPQEVTISSSSQSTPERWLHVRFIDTNHKGEPVRVNAPLKRAKKVPPAINKDRLHNGKV